MVENQNQNPFNLVSYIMNKNEIIIDQDYARETNLSKTQVHKFWLFDNTDSTDKLGENILTLSCGDSTTEPILDSWRYLLCSYNSSFAELRNFLRRAILDPLKRVYIISNLEQLSDAMKTQFLEELEYLRNLRLTVENGADGATDQASGNIQDQLQ